MWALLTLIFTYLRDGADGKLATIIENQEKLLMKTDDIARELQDTRANLANIQADEAALKDLVKTGNDQIQVLNVKIAELAAQNAEVAGLDAVLAAAQDLNATSKQMADQFPETAPEPAPEPPAV